LNPQRANRRRARWQTASPRASAYWASSLNETQLCRCAWSRMTPSLISQIRFYARTRPVRAELFTADRRLIIAGCSYYWPEAYSVAVLPRLYGAAFLSFGLATMDGLERKNRCECTFGPSVKSRNPRCQFVGSQSRGPRCLQDGELHVPRLLKCGRDCSSKRTRCESVWQPAPRRYP
jgi:hypothetical protein